MAQPKTIVITGASTGIGAALARCLATEHHNLVLAARREKELNVVGGEAQTLGASGVACVVADVTIRGDVERIAREAIERFGGFDVWVNNAGRGITRDVLDLSDADVDEMVKVNVKSVIYGMQVAAKHFIGRGSGQIVNVSSFLARVPLASSRSIYSAAKAAVNSLTANARTDLATRAPKVHVTLVMPSVVTTDFSTNAIGEKRPPVTTAPSQTPDEVAKIIAGVIAKPVAEIYTNPGSSPLVKAYQDDIVAFEAKLRSQ